MLRIFSLPFILIGGIDAILFIISDLLDETIKENKYEL